MGFTLKGGIAADEPCSEKMSGQQERKEKQPFAVYSSTDDSLRFYSRERVPEPGEELEGRTADAVYAREAFDGHRWDAYADDVKTVEVVDEGIAPESTAYWFYRFNRMTSCDLSKLDTGNVVDMRWMFEGCVSLEELELSSFDVSRVDDMERMFAGCSSLKELNLSSFDTGRVESMSGMFCGCSSLEYLDLTAFDTASACCFYAMFAGCSSLRDLDLSSFDTSSVDDMRRMFSGCGALRSLDLSSFDFREGVKLCAFAAFCEAAVEAMDGADEEVKLEATGRSR